MPAVLTHGDLWSGNLVSQPGGRVTVIDPAVSYTWAEVDLSMLWCSPRPPAAARFFEIYQELNPSPPGWADRMPVLHLRAAQPGRPPITPGPFRSWGPGRCPCL
jgi:fructosamine-3-kinase